MGFAVLRRVGVLILLCGNAAWSAMILRGGLTLANMSFDPDPPSNINVGTHSGFHLGILGDFPINPSMRFLLGGAFEGKGVEMTDNLYGGSATFNFNYLEFPLLLSVGNAVYSPRMSRFFFNFGVEPSFKTSSKAESGGQNLTVSGVSSFDFGLVLEAGGEVPISPNGIYMVFGGGYTRNVVNNDDDPYSSTKAFNYSFKFFGGFKFSMNLSASAAPGWTAPARAPATAPPPPAQETPAPTPASPAPQPAPTDSTAKPPPSPADSSSTK